MKSKNQNTDGKLGKLYNFVKKPNLKQRLKNVSNKSLNFTGGLLTGIFFYPTDYSLGDITVYGLLGVGGMSVLEDVFKITNKYLLKGEVIEPNLDYLVKGVMGGFYIRYGLEALLK